MPKLAAVSRFCLWLVFALITGIALIASAAFLYLSPNLPSVDVLRDVRLQIPLRVYSRDGKLLGEFGEMRRTPMQVAEVPPLFIKAVLAAEDDNFFHHRGIDITSLTRAATQLLASGHIQTGGSTITMQVAKNYFLSYERTFSRKFNEILLALQIERSLSKEQILELYLNKIFLGNRAYGVEAAAQTYYGKSIRELTLGQWATLAGIPKSPSTANPLANPERARDRRNWILGRMRDLGDIDQTQYQAAVAEPIDASYHGAILDMEAGYVAEMVRQEMLQRFGQRAYTEGFSAHTTLDSNLQARASHAVVEGLLTYNRRHGYHGPEKQLKGDASSREEWLKQLRALPSLAGLQAAAVTQVETQRFQALLGTGEAITVEWDNGIAGRFRFIDENRRGPSPTQAADVVAIGDVVRVRQKEEGIWELQPVPAIEGALVSMQADTGAILSLVGGFDFQQSKFNRVTQAERLPGSSFKPLLYAAALSNGFTPATVINDAPIVYADNSELQGAWRPVNDTGRFYGPTPLRQALYKSRNVVSIRLLQQLGINRAVDFVVPFGFIPEKLPRNLSLALGSLSTTPLQMARSYAAFANGGFRVEPYLLDRVVSLDGNTLYQAQPGPLCDDCSPTEPPASSDPAVVMAPPAAADDTIEQQPNLAPPKRVIDPGVAFIMDTILRDVVRRGTATKALALNRSDVAGKTGTTNGPTDVWFSGYSGGIVTTTWVGFDQYQQLGRQEYASTLALPIWIDYMRGALAEVPERQFRQPQNVVSLRIDPHTGLRAYTGQTDAVFEYFTTDSAPQSSADGATDYIDAGGSVEQQLF